MSGVFCCLLLALMELEDSIVDSVGTGDAVTAAEGV